MHRVNMGTGLTSAEPVEKGMLQATKEVFGESPPTKVCNWTSSQHLPGTRANDSSVVPSPSLLD